MADVGSTLAQKLVDDLTRTSPKPTTPEGWRTALATLIEQQLAPHVHPFTLPDKAVVVLVGVNGSGKTTLIGKLCHLFSAQGKRCMVAAADTFRAAAADQLNVWAQRLNVPIIQAEKPNADPASVVFTALQNFQASNADVLFIDTAGRLANRNDLMAELEKTLRVIKKADPSAPHAVLLVIDSTIGQSAIPQVQLFKQAAGVSGLVLTKLDSSAKAGVVLQLIQLEKVPLHFISTGEGLADLQPFNARDFSRALVGL
jgi:fused signal recognition particle receptor